MKFRATNFYLLLLAPVISFSQSENNTDVTNITKLNFLSPGISYEQRIGKFQTVYGQALMDASYGIGYSSSLGNTSFIFFDPTVSIQYRYYYNAKRREAKGKRTAMNSLNYISPGFETSLSKRRISSSYFLENKLRAIHKIGIAWGFQRNYKKRFSLDISIGPGYLFTKVTDADNNGQIVTRHIGQFSTVGQLSFGFWLNKKK